MLIIFIGSIFNGFLRGLWHVFYRGSIIGGIFRAKESYRVYCWEKPKRIFHRAQFYITCTELHNHCNTITHMMVNIRRNNIPLSSLFLHLQRPSFKCAIDVIYYKIIIRAISCYTSHIYWILERFPFTRPDRSVRPKRTLFWLDLNFPVETFTNAERFAFHLNNLNGTSDRSNRVNGKRT